MTLTIQLADQESYEALAQPVGTESSFQQRNWALKALSVMAEAVSTQLSVDAVLQQALDQTLDTLGVEAGAITLINEETGELVFRAQKGWQVHDFVQEGIHLQADEGLTGSVMHTGRPVVTADVDQDSRIAVDTFRDEPVKAMILAPMRARGKVLGLLSAMSYRPRRFTQEAVALLTAIADQIGVAVDNARLYEQEQERRRLAETLLQSERRRAEEMALLRNTIVQMAGTNELPEMLESLTQAALELSQAPIVEVDLYNAARDRLTLGMALHTTGSRRPLCSAPHHNPAAWEAVHRHDTIETTVSSDDGYLAMINFVVAIPMIQQNPNGVILLGYGENPHLDAQAYSSLALLANQAALALDRLSLYIQERRKATYLMLVNQIGQTAVEKLRNSALLPRVTNMIQQGFGLYNVSLYMGHPLTLKASSGGKPVFPEIVVDSGLPMLASEQRKPLISNRTKDDPRCRIPFWVAEHAQAEMAVPLLKGERVIGILDLFSVDPDIFDAIDLETMNTLASQLAVILENGQLYAQMERRVAELSAVQDVSLQVLGALDTAALTHTVARPFLELLNASAVIVYRVRAGRLILPSTQITQPGHLPSEDLIQMLAREALTLREPLIVGTVEGLPWKHSNLSWDTHGGMLAIPLSGRGTLQGMLLLYYQTFVTLTEDEHRSLELLKNLAAVALSKAGLYEEIQQRVQELTLLYEIALSTRALNTPYDITETVTEALRKTMGWQNVEVYQWEEASNALLPIYKSKAYTPVIPLETGLPSWVAKQRRPMRLGHEIKTGPHSGLVEAEIAVPLMISEHLVGVLHVRSHRDCSFDARDEGFLTTVAHLLAVTLENVNLHQQTTQQLQEMATLYDISRSISRTLQLEDVLQGIVTSIQSALDARGCCIALLDESTQELVIRASAGTALCWQKNMRLPLGRGIAGIVAEQGKARYVRDTNREPEFAFLDRAVRSLIMAPLISSKAKVIGTLSVDSTKPYAFSQVDERLVTVAATQASIAIENAQLYENLAQQNKILNQAYQELKELAETKDTLVQNISHELRTPLTYIKGYIELFAEGNIGELNEEQKQTIDLVARQTEKVIHIVNKIISLQQLDRTSLKRSPVSIGDILSEVIAQSEEETKHKSITVHLQHIDSDLLIYGDQERLNQLCTYLIDNAIKFSPYGGNVWAGAVSEKGLIHLTVMDQGIGIPSNQLQNIFDTFYQVDGSTTRRFGGLGLGLAVVRRIAEAHEGMVWAESEVGKGSTFHVLLPQYIPNKEGSRPNGQNTE